MILFISGQEEKDILRKALCSYLSNNESERCVKLLARVVKCTEMQDKPKAKKAATPKDSD